MIGHNVHAEVVEEGEHRRANDGDAIFEVAGEVGIASNGDDAVYRNRNCNALPELRVVGVARDAGAVRIGQLHGLAGRDIAIGRSAAYVEAAQFRVAAGIEAVVGGRNIAAKSLDIAELSFEGQHVMPVGAELEIVHRAVGLEGHQRRVVAHVAPDAGCLQCRRKFLA